MRKKLFEIIDPSEGKSKLDAIYDILMMLAIVASILPLAFKSTNAALEAVERVTVVIFAADYLLRLFTADHKLKKGALSFLLYPFTPMAVVDLISILPALPAFNDALRLLRLVRFLRTLKVLRAFKFLRYSKSFGIITRVLQKQKKVLGAVATLAVVYVLISALVIYNVEPESFNTFFDAVYWATISLTTVGYGDIYPVTTVGRIVTMVSSVFGIAVIALPSGVITAGYMNEIAREERSREDDE